MLNEEHLQLLQKNNPQSIKTEGIFNSSPLES